MSFIIKWNVENKKSLFFAELGYNTAIWPRALVEDEPPQRVAMAMPNLKGCQLRGKRKEEE